MTFRHAKSLWPLACLAGIALLQGCAPQTPPRADHQVSAVSAVDPDERDDARQCAALTQVALPGVTINEARWVAAGSKSQEAGGALAPLVAHCLIHGVIDARRGVPAPVLRPAPGAPSSNDVYGLKFELRLPEKWQRRFLYQGGGGSDGKVIDAVGLIPSLQDAHAYTPALSRGFAVVSSDAGHTEDQNPTFGLDPKARLDYGYQSIGRVTPVALALVRAFYSADPRYRYFAGCSKGGQEALQAMQQYGDQFDGIVSGDPGMRLPHAAIAEINDTQALLSIAPPGPDGKPDLKRAFCDQDLQLVSSAVAQQCTGGDGTQDKMNYDPEHCHFDPQVLQCRGDKAADCLSPGQVGALHRIFDGAKDKQGRPLYTKWPYDPGIASANWRLWKLGNDRVAGLNATLGAESMRYVFTTPPLGDRDPLSLDLDTLADLIQARTAPYDVPATAFMDADNAAPDTFTAHGGKLLIYHGTADPVFSVFSTIDYYHRMQAHYGARTDSMARLFLVPGMNHCSGGDTALDSFDSLQAVVNWVEQGRAPDAMIASAGRRSGSQLPQGMTRPLCPYPQTAHYNGQGNPDDAASFSCRAPS